MRAALYDRYGKADVVTVREVPAPTPGPKDVRVRVHAAALNPKDVVIRSGRFGALTGKRFPRRVGFDFAGEVLEVGREVQGFRVGERVYGMLDGFSGGTFADEVLAPAHVCAAAPASLSFEEAASLPLASLTALQALRDVGRLREGGSVLVNGGSGGVGVHAIQIARALGAKVTTISSARNRDFCRSLGAQTTLAYDEDALFRERGAYDVVLDAFGNRTFAEVEPTLARGGTFVAMVPKPAIALDVARTAFASKRARFIVVRPSRTDLETLAGWVREGKVRPVIDRAFPLEAAADAMRHLETKRARGKIVIRVSA